LAAAARMIASGSSCLLGAVAAIGTTWFVYCTAADVRTDRCTGWRGDAEAGAVAGSLDGRVGFFFNVVKKSGDAELEEGGLQLDATGDTRVDRGVEAEALAAA
jgi:hypothetical protein